MQQLKVSQDSVSDEIHHEVGLALASANDFLNQQQATILRNIGTFFSREQILKLSRGDSWSPLPQAES